MIHAPIPQDAPPHAVAVDRPVADDHHSHVPTKYRRHSGRWVALFVGVVFVALTVIFIKGHITRRRESEALAAAATRGEDAAVPVDVVHVKAGSSETDLALEGEARGFYETTLFARTNGYVSKWVNSGDKNPKLFSIDIGDHVAEGEVLASIETPELDDQIVAARAKVDQLEAEVHVAETNVDFARLSAKRWKAATPEGAVSEQESDQKQSELKASEAKAESAKAQVALGQADLQRLLTMQKFKNVVAPLAGTITSRHANIGDLVTAGSNNNNTPLFTLVQTDPILVHVNVPQAAAGRILKNMEVTVKTLDGTHQTFTGRVDRTSESLDLESRTLRVYVQVPNHEGALRPGSYLQAIFHTKRIHPPLEIPAAAINFKTGGAQVAVINADDRVEFRDVTIENDMGDKLEVTGLKDGEMIALNIGSHILNGQKVEAHILDASAKENPATMPVSPVREAAIRTPVPKE